MARSARQSKILEIIQTKEIETQDELVSELRRLNFDITQATISRDIKELGLIKILSDSKKYKYAYVDSSEQSVSNKYLNVFKESIISVKAIKNLVVIKTLKGIAAAVSTCLDKLSLKYFIGTVFGDDTVMAICLTDQDAQEATIKILDMI